MYRIYVLIGALVISALIVLSGCTLMPSQKKMSEAECLSADWYVIGERDGGNGLQSTRFNKYVKDCTGYGVNPDLEEYSKGRTEGLKSYCTRVKGYSEGRNGRKYRFVCSDTAEEEFLKGHSLGFSVHSSEELVENIDRDIANVNSKIELSKKEVAKLRVKMFDLDSTEPLGDAISLRKDLDRLNDRIRDEKAEIEVLEQRKIGAVIDYRETVEKANDNGFSEVKRY